MSLLEKQSEKSDMSSSVSVKSDHSMGVPPQLTDKTPPSTKSVRSGSHVSSSLSMKSDQSIGVPPQLSDKTPSSTTSVRSGSHVSSSVSMKSDQSIGVPPQLSDETPSSTTSVRSGSHVSSSVSMKSDQSIGVPPQLSDKTPSSTTRKKSFSRSASLKSDHSKCGGPNSSERKTSFAKRQIMLKPSNVAELQQFCKDEWAKIPPQRCNRFITSYRKHLIAVVAAKGGPTSY
ncbi:uncharacterized protein [Chanodichthys erythropterus]|uniref:uncharacterized protein n=1 Tax=Chanodichthys erythropterus TaxID=933992 RepID=UPI00351E65E4